MSRAKKWFVLTGGPSCGKTTLLTELRKRGYATVPEAARTVIDQAMQRGISPEELRKDERTFQDDVARMKIALEQSLDESAVTFFDRGMQDSIAYLRHYGFAMPPWLTGACEQAKYAQIFLLEPLAHYQKDYARTENDDFFQHIHGLLRQAYEEAGLPIAMVPALPVNERVTFVLQQAGLGVAV